MVPARQLEEALKRFCKKLFVHTGVKDYPYQFFGSSCALKVGETHLLFCCGHQIDQCDPENIAFLHSGTNTTITAARKIWLDTDDFNKDTDLIDVRAFEYPMRFYKAPNLTHEFFELVPRVNTWPTNAAVGNDHLFLIFGYPTDKQLVDYEVPHIHATMISTTGKYDGRSNSPHLHRIRIARDEKFGADGLSGGPVFYLGDAGGNTFFAGFAGMMMRGSEGSDIVYFMDADFITKLFGGPISDS